MTLTTLDPSVTSGSHDFRQLIQKKLAIKQSQLGETEDTIKKLIPSGPPMGDVGGGGKLARFQNRLGPPQAGGRRRSDMGARLGPKIDNDRPPFRDFDDPEGVVTTLSSRVVVEQKSREEALKDMKATENKKEVQRNRRMFGNLLGTLQRFRQDETRVRDREKKKQIVEKKVEERTEKEKEEARQRKRDLFVERKRQRHEIKVLQVQMKRVEEFECWERTKRQQMQFIRTKSGPASVFYLPKEHTEKTINLLEETMETIEKEIAEARQKFEEDLLKLEAKVKDMQHDPEDEELDEDEDDEDENTKPKSKIVVSSSKLDKEDGERKRRRSAKEDGEEEESKKKEEEVPEKKEEERKRKHSEKDEEEVSKRRRSEEPVKIIREIKEENGTERRRKEEEDNTKEERTIKMEKKEIKIKKEEKDRPKRSSKREKDSAERKKDKRRKRKSSSSSSSSESSSEDSSDSSESDSSEDEKERKKRKIKKEKE